MAKTRSELFLDASEVRSQADARELLLHEWREQIGPLSRESAKQVSQAVGQWPLDVLWAAVEITAAKVGTPGCELSLAVAATQAEVFQSVLNEWPEERTH